MTISFVGSAENSAINGGNVTVDLSGLSLAEDDVVYCFAAIGSLDSETPSLSISGYTQLDSQALNGSAGNRMTCIVERKVQTASPDSDLTVTVTSGSTTMATSAIAFAYRGVDTSTPEDATTTFSTGENSQPDGASITTVTDNAVVINSAHVHTPNVAVTAPSGYGNQAELGANDSNKSATGVADKTVASFGAENPGVWSGWDQATSRPWISYTVAVKPLVMSSVVFRRRIEGY